MGLTLLAHPSFSTNGLLRSHQFSPTLIRQLPLVGTAAGADLPSSTPSAPHAPQGPRPRSLEQAAQRTDQGLERRAKNSRLNNPPSAPPRSEQKRQLGQPCHSWIPVVWTVWARQPFHQRAPRSLPGVMMSSIRARKPAFGRPPLRLGFAPEFLVLSWGGTSGLRTQHPCTCKEVTGRRLTACFLPDRVPSRRRLHTDRLTLSDAGPSVYPLLPGLPVSRLPGTRLLAGTRSPRTLASICSDTRCF